MAKIMDHSRYAKAMRAKSDEQLRFIINDAAEAARVNPQGENAGYYLDEVHYAAAELRRRRAD